MDDIDDIRARIDVIDSQIVGLLDERARLGRAAAMAKRAAGLPAHDSGREIAVMWAVLDASDGSMPADALGRIYGEIIAGTRLAEVEPTGAPGRPGGA